jgi:putative ABC transport system permease protein
VAVVLAAVAGGAVARFLFDGTFSLPLLPMSALAAAIVLLTVVVGLSNSRDVVRRAPLEVLREE